MFKGFTTTPRQGKFSPVPLALRTSNAGRGRSVCIVSDGAAVETEDYPLVVQLQKDGWSVSILDTVKPGLSDRDFDKAAYQRLAGLYSETNWYIQMQSLTAYHWLRGCKFDLILFHHSFGAGFYSCMARYLGLAFAHTPIIIYADETHAGMLERTLTLPSGRNDFEIDFMERRAIALSDGVIVGAKETAVAMRETGWEFPPSVACMTSGGKGDAWGKWLDRLVKPGKAPKSVRSKPVFISVCMATHNRPLWLREALQSLENQTANNFEVIVVDDGSTDPGVKKLKNDVAKLFKKKGWRWQRQKNAGPAAARNYAAKIAKGDYLLFMDDDDIACPDEIERFSIAAARGGDIITCILGMHPSSENAFPPTAQLPERQDKATRPVGWTPIGGTVALIALINVAGFAHSLYSRKVFKKLGGFKSGKDMVLEDIELITRALIAGCRIDVVPEVLMLYRRTKQSRSMGHNIFAGHLNSLQPLAAMLPLAFRPLLLSLRHDWYHRNLQRRDGKL